MKICLISDIHANLPALQAVLAHAASQGCKEIWNLGDAIGYSPYPEETIKLLRTKKIISILGNYDLKVLEFRKYRAAWQRSKHPAKFFSFSWTHKNLSAASKEYLRSLPIVRRLYRAGHIFVLVHDMSQYFKKMGADIVCSGHSHYFSQKRVRAQLRVNPGSIGRTPEATPFASYAVMEVTTSRVSVRHFRVPYPYKGMVLRMRSLRFPEFLVQSVIKKKLAGYVGK